MLRSPIATNRLVRFSIQASSKITLLQLLSLAWLLIMPKLHANLHTSTSQPAGRSACDGHKTDI
jgi:hypothetical protein